MVRAVGARVAAMEEGPVGGRDLAADAPLEADARIGDLAPVLLQLLALVVAHRAEKIREVAIAAILPAELDAVAHDHPSAGAGLRLRSRREQHVQRRATAAAVGD